MTDEEIKQLAADIRGNLVFGTWNIPPGEDDMVRHIFMCSMFMDETHAKRIEDEQVVHVYEYLSKAGPTGINGYPSFFSMRMLTKPDAKRLGEILDALKNAEKQAMEAMR